MMSMFAIFFSVAAAHQPTFSADHADPDDAYAVEDEDLSIVLYQEISCEIPRVWLRYDTDPGYDLWLQLGVPVIDRLVDYRPSIAVLAAGLPEVELPFETPEGLGGVIYDTESVEPGTFYEAFTATESWVIFEDEVTIPEGGEVFVVAWHPAGQTGKLWVASGTVEDFSDVDWDAAADWGELVNDFHETGAYSDPPLTVDTTCEVEEAAPEEEEAAPTGCAAAGAPAAGWALLGALGLLRRRRPRAA